LRAGSLVAVDVPLPERRFFSVRHKERYFGRAEQAFLDMIDDKPAGVRATP